MTQLPFIRKIKQGFCKRILILSWFSIFALTLGELGRFHWILELFSHFLPYYCLLFLLGSCIAQPLWQKLLFLASMAGAIMLISSISVFAPFQQQSPERPHYPPVHFLSQNLFLHNASLQKSIDWIVNQNAEILFLTEVTLSQQSVLAQLNLRYPYGCQKPEDSPFGLALYSQQPLVSCQVLYLKDSSFPLIRAQLQDRRIIYGIHPPPPVSFDNAYERNFFFDRLADKILAESHDVLVMGDMNSTPFSPVYRTFLRKSRLRPATSLFVPTWIPGMLVLDQILVNTAYPALKHGVGPWYASDHRPIFVLW